VGNYSVVTKFAEHKTTGVPVPPMGFSRGGDVFINDTFLASTSDPVYFTAQEEPIQPWSEPPLPTNSYWTLPVNSMNREWYPIVGNWLAGAAQNVGPTSNFAYGTGPESAHIMWATPMWAGGIMDARFGDIGYQTMHYEGLGFIPPIILDGKIYYNVQSNPKRGWYCLDLYTGETLYFHNTTGPVVGTAGGIWDAHGTILGESLAFGQIYNYESANQHGGFPYLWSTNTLLPTGAISTSTWMMFDAYSGDYICSIANVSAPFGSVSVYGKDGSILYYNMVGTGANKRLTVWNTSQAIWWRASWPANQYWMWRPYQNGTFDGRNGFSLNASIPDVQGSILAVREDQYVIGGTSGKNNGTYVLQGNLWALNLKADSNGIINPTLLWNITFTPPQGVPDITITSVISLGSSIRGGMTGPTVDPEDGVFVFREPITRRWWGFSLETGQQLWGPTESEIAQNYYGMNYNIYDGKLLSYGSGQSGTELVAYDIKTGKILWKYIPQQVGFESPYGTYPLVLACIADGKIYMYSSEHSPTQPLWRGSYLRCINASNGAELWKINHWGSAVASNGYLVGWNAYDNQIYCYGKGPSATTVTASPKVSVHESNVLIEGTVTDQSPGAKDTPAIADESMQAWMEYLYMQQAIPGNATGVEVTLDAVDPNGNFVHIGSVTSDMSGMFKKAFTPEVPGEYTIIATFAGSNSYGSSYAETAIDVSEAPQATPPVEIPAYPDYTPLFIGIIAAVVVAIVIGIVNLAMLKKRK
jgi:hypothetical protein